MRRAVTNNKKTSKSKVKQEIRPDTKSVFPTTSSLIANTDKKRPVGQTT